MGGSPSRRRLLQSIGVLGLVTGASAQTAASDGDHLGEVIHSQITALPGVSAAHPSFLQERLK